MGNGKWLKSKTAKRSCHLVFSLKPVIGKPLTLLIAKQKEKQTSTMFLWFLKFQLHRSRLESVIGSSQLQMLISDYNFEQATTANLKLFVRLWTFFNIFYLNRIEICMNTKIYLFDNDLVQLVDSLRVSVMSVHSNNCRLRSL